MKVDIQITIRADDTDHQPSESRTISNPRTREIPLRTQASCQWAIECMKEAQILNAGGFKNVVAGIWGGKAHCVEVVFVNPVS